MRKAIEEYTLGIAIIIDKLAKTVLPSSSVVIEQEEEEVNDEVIEGESEDALRVLLSQLYNNRSFAALNLGNNKRCVEDAEKCLEIDEKNIKAYFRAATACKNLFEYEKCLVFCKRGLEH